MATMEILTEQVRMLTQQVLAQQAALQQADITRFELTPAQIIRNFNDVKPFSGEDNYKLKSFLKSVQGAEQLCGDRNIELKEYCLGQVINGKIIGKARNSILEIPENLRSWNTVVQTLTLKFRPKQTIHQLMFQAKEIKVYNLKDLFNKLTQFKSDANEICDYDNEDRYTYDMIDKELIQILKIKIIPLVQMQIDESKTLFELDNFLCKSEIYIDETIIKPMYKLSKFDKFHLKNQSRFENTNKQLKSHESLNHKINNPNKPYHQHSGQYRQNFQYRPNNFYNNRNYNNKNGYPNQNRSAQVRNVPQPMEVDTVNQNPEIENGVKNESVNFTN